MEQNNKKNEMDFYKEDIERANKLIDFFKSEGWDFETAIFMMRVVDEQLLRYRPGMPFPSRNSK